MWVQSLGLEDPLQEETHYRIPAWNIPRTEEPGELPSKRSRTVGHNWTHEHIVFIDLKKIFPQNTVKELGGSFDKEK